jgi:predicted nucleic acid-binding protein
LEGVELLAIDEEVLSRASVLGPPVMRSLDAIHLASALTLGRELDAVVTYDRRLASAAEQVGLRVESPA